jgi:predicted ATP-dependent serine protease
VVPAYDPYALLDTLHMVYNASETASPKLVVIDSISAVLGPYIGGKDDTGQKVMTHTYAMMRQIILKHNAALLVTRHNTFASPRCLFF